MTHDRTAHLLKRELFQIAAQKVFFIQARRTASTVPCSLSASIRITFLFSNAFILSGLRPKWLYFEQIRSCSYPNGKGTLSGTEDWAYPLSAASRESLLEIDLKSESISFFFGIPVSSFRVFVISRRTKGLHRLGTASIFRRSSSQPRRIPREARSLQQEPCHESFRILPRYPLPT